VEDTDFFNHHGLNYKGIIRALYKNTIAGGFVQGGSTLTQQLARNILLKNREKKLKRKIKEAILAVQIERNYTKPEILEMYLNQVYWGHNAYGIESASQLYFGKHAEDLNLEEAAILVGMLKGPELYSPFRNYSGAKRRQRTVLSRMEKVKLITKKVANAAYVAELDLIERKKFKYKAPFFTSYIVKQLTDMFGEEATYTSGMKVYTTLNYALQEKAGEIVNKWVEEGKKPYWIKGEKVASLNFTEAALLALEPSTGYIKVMQGGVDFMKNQFNRTVQAKRQPGSAFKPFVYLAALEKGFSPGTIIEDSPVTFNTIEGPYAPLNYTLKYLGPLPMRKALEKSVNVVAIKLNDLVGPKNVVRVAQEIGITSPLKPILSLPLGANEVSMLELSSAYSVFANNGRRVEPTGIIRIEDRFGTPLFDHEMREKKVFQPNLIAALVEMMRGVVNYGTGKNARLPRPVAGKTGTTSDYRDAWFVGFVPQLVCATWVGNDDNTPMKNMTGGWIPALMWKDFMKEALKGVPAVDFPKPRGMVQRKVNWQTGLLATEFSTPEKVSTEKFWKGSEPTEYDSFNSPSRVIGRTVEEENDMLDFFEVH